MSVTRRSFVGGIIAALSSSEALVKLATPAEAAELSWGSSVLLGAPQAPRFPDAWFTDPEVFMRNASGKFECVGVLRRIDTSIEVLEAATWEGEFTVAVPGLQRVTGRFSGPQFK